MKVIVGLRRGNSRSHHSVFHPTAGAAGVAIRRSTAKSEGKNCHLEEEQHFENSFPVSEIISSLVYAYLYKCNFSVEQYPTLPVECLLTHSEL